MIKFYYRTGIISGLAVTISTSTAFLLLNHNFYSMVITLFSLILGGSVAKSAYDFFSFRLWTCLYSLMSCYGAFLAIYWHDEALSYVGFVLIGLTAGGFLFILPPNLMITWFGQSKSFMLGSLWSISTLFGVSLRILIKIFPYMILTIITFSLMISCFFLLKKFPVDYIDGQGKREALSTKKTLAVCLFLFALSLSTALMLRMSFSSYDYDTAASSLIILIPGALLCPVLLSAFMEKKGTFSGAVTAIFLSESCIMILSFYNNPILNILTPFLIGATVTAPLVLYPLLTYYLFGPGGYNRRIGVIFSSFPIGYLAAFLLPIPLDSLYFVVSFTIALLLCSFFAVFSAWKHRLVLLKSS